MTYQFYITDDITHGDGGYNDKPNREFLPFEKFLLNIETNEKILNNNYDTSEADKVVAELKKQAPYEEKIDTAHENYDYSYARINADDGYGTIEEQLEYIAENGVTAFKSKQAAVKTRYPKPE